MNLSGKKVLLFTSVLFTYHDQIKSAIEKLGTEVHLYDERDNPSSIEKILIRKARFLMKKRTVAYYLEVCEKEKTFNPDYVLFVSPEAVVPEALRILKSSFKDSIFILYMWDSVRNKHNENIIGYFDRKLSFDPLDCDKYGMTLRPLFFSNENGDELKEAEYLYDVSFIGTIHSDRAKILWKIKKYCEANNLKYYFYLFVPGKLMYFLRMATDRYLRKWDKKYIHTEMITKDKVTSVSSGSRCIIDINHPKQTGLTMRTIEMVGINRKIFTTNKNIVSYDFYRPENQIVIDRNTMEIEKDMIKNEYSSIPAEIKSRYSIDSWAIDLFELEFEKGFQFAKIHS